MYFGVLFEFGKSDRLELQTSKCVPNPFLHAKKNAAKKTVQNKLCKKGCAKIIANLVAPTGAESLPKPSIQPCKKTVQKKTVQKKKML